MSEHLIERIFRSYQEPLAQKGHYHFAPIKPETWRDRISNNRFFYTINDSKKIVSMITVDTREDSY